MNNRVLLINPPVADNKVWVREGRCQQWDIWGAPFPPFSLAMISRQLTNAGRTTRIIDAGPQHKTLDDVLNEAKKYDPYLVILATTTPTLYSDLSWFTPALKRTLPSIFIAGIGIHVSAYPQETLERFNFLDGVIIGEPELTVSDLSSELYLGHGLDNVSGLGFRSIDGEIRINPRRKFAPEIDLFGFPEWEKISVTDYMLPIFNRPFLLIGFSRGCPHKCRFCAAHVYNGRLLRRRSVPAIIQEIKRNLQLGVFDFLFWNEHMTIDRSYLMAFLDALIADNLHTKIKWVCNSRVDSVDQEMLNRMHEAGCWQIAYGFEFGNDETLRLANKGGRASIQQGRIAAEMADKAGIFVDGHFMMGYPGETVKSLNDTIAFACSLPLTFAHFYATVPFPGSELYEEALEKGWICEDALGSLTQDLSAIKTEALSPEDVNDHIKRAYIRFYGNPVQWLKILSIAKSMKDALGVISTSIKFITSMIRR